MNILLPHSWLSEYLDTNAKPEEIARYISLCGPTFDRADKVKIDGKSDTVYDIEVTTNRVDAMSVRGIAREAAAILPRFDVKAKLRNVRMAKITNRSPLGIEIKNDPKLCHRILAVKIEGVKVANSPKKIQDRLSMVGQRPLNNLVDITNYVMWEIGHPTHVFDYDKLVQLGGKIVVREGKKGEKVESFDGKKYKLGGGEVVFDNGKGEIIDLPGIIGTKNSVVSKDTKNALFFLESTNALRIRKASIGLGIRTNAAILNEKNVDPELGLGAILRGAELFNEFSDGKVASELIDIYPKPYSSREVSTTYELIATRLGVEVSKTTITEILDSLDFRPKWRGNTLITTIPSFRDKDINIPEDIIEEVARIYGYHNLPSVVMEGKIPDTPKDPSFGFEMNIKRLLKGLGGNEVYSYSLVSKDMVNKNALGLKNPLGKDSSHLRTSLAPSLEKAVNENRGESTSFHLFEMSNVYLPQKNKLPNEKLTLAGAFQNTEYRKAKGVVVVLLEKLNVKYSMSQKNIEGFMPNRAIYITGGNKQIGKLGYLKNSNLLYYEFDINQLQEASNQTKRYTPIPKYPAQIEDITLLLRSKTKVGDLLQSIKSHKLVSGVELTTIFQNAHTFRIWYQDPKKTLTDSEVGKVRNEIITIAKQKFGVSVQE